MYPVLTINRLWAIFGVLVSLVVVSADNTTFALKRIKNYGEKSLDKIQWLHPPRTGSGIAVTLLRYSCETYMDENVEIKVSAKVNPWKTDTTCANRLMHASPAFWLPNPLRNDEMGSVVAMFRRPKDRLASQLRWMRSMVGFITLYGVDEKDVQPIMQALSNVPVSKSMNSSHPCARFRTPTELRLCRYLAASHFPGLRGCMTKMILGYNCAERYKLTTADVEEAKRRVRSEFAFIGIAEKPAETARLFHGMYGGDLYSDELFSRIRESPPAVENVKKALLNAYDYFDEELYITALQVFEKQKALVEEKIRMKGSDLF